MADSSAIKRYLTLLPFLKKKSIAGLIISKRKPDGAGNEEQHTEGNEDEGLDACSEALIRAVTSKDAKAVSAALRDAFMVLESQPHEEAGEGPEAHSYDAQNEKAAK